MVDGPSSHEVTIVQHNSWLSRAGGAFAGLIFGPIVILSAIGLLSWNEGRAVTSISALDWAAGSVISIADNTIAPLNEGKLVHLTADAKATEAVRDPVFGISGSGLLRLHRKVEMYQWEEISETHTETSVGGTETTTTTYRYKRDWFQYPVDSSSFQNSSRHQNPPMPYRSTSFEPVRASFGAFTLTREQLARLDTTEPVSDAMRMSVRPPAGFEWQDDQLYRGASYHQPEVGDIRVTLTTAPDQPVTIVAGQRGQGFIPFIAPNGYEINLLKNGAHDAAAMVSEARAEEVAITWILRGVGLLLMVMGFVLLNAPLVWLASLLPPLANLVQVAAFGLAILLAVPLTLLTIAIAWLAHRPMLAGGLILAGLVVVPLILRFLKAPANTPGAIPSNFAQPHVAMKMSGMGPGMRPGSGSARSAVPVSPMPAAPVHDMATPSSPPPFPGSGHRS